jgi:hypothetical protein
MLSRFLFDYNPASVGFLLPFAGEERGKRWVAGIDRGRRGEQTVNEWGNEWGDGRPQTA